MAFIILFRDNVECLRSARVNSSVRPLFDGRGGHVILTANCDLTVNLSFSLEHESLKDTLLQYYVGFSEDFAAAGFGQCSPPMVLLPQSVEIGGVQQIIPGKFAFDCTLSLSEVKSALGQFRRSFTDMNPKPDLSVTLHDRDGHNHIRLFPRNDIEIYLSDW